MGSEALRILAALFLTVLILALVGLGGGIYVLYEYGRGLPEYRQLADYEPPNVTRVHAGDGQLLAELAQERRIFVPIESIPLRLRNAFLSAEDKNFYRHPGVDPLALIRATLTNIRNLTSNRRPVGASTITQQVAKNFLLSGEVSINRKIREAILAFRIEHSLSKDRILELYLNEIYLGGGAYGVAAAALHYFDKSLDDLSVAEAAYLAALPKAPNNYHPRRNHDAAKARRDWVLGQMEENGFIADDQLEEAQAEPLETQGRGGAERASADYFAEEVRRDLNQLYGGSSVLEAGLSVRTTVDPRLQRLAKDALREGLLAYDRRHGWRGAHAGIELGSGWEERLADTPPPAGMPDSWRLAAVLDLGSDSTRIGFGDGSEGTIPMAEMRWARPTLRDQRYGHPPERPSDVVEPGDVITVSRMEEVQEPVFTLEQIPNVEGAIVALDPHTGRVLAMQGGFAYQRSEFNRVTQAGRQPGSAFKPFVYLSALERGYSPATIILDAPFVIDQGGGLGKWKPANYSREFYGPTPMRVGIEKSRNLMTVRMAQSVGMDKVSDTAERFGVYDDMPEQLSMALGAGETTLLRLASAYGMLVNGGKRIEPAVIDRVQDRRGRTVFKHDDRDCEGCTAESWENQPPPDIPDPREQVTDPASAYQIVSMLEGVVKRGTGRRLRSIGKPLAGKTGTTNDGNDSWFMGFSPDLVAGVYVGFDEPRTLGRGETGSSVAAPIFESFMERALEDQPALPFRIPSDIRMVRMDLDTGRRAQSGSETVILEAFKRGQGPGETRRVIRGGQPGDTETSASPQPATEGASGLY